jgi:hypothetical protein
MEVKAKFIGMPISGYSNGYEYLLRFQTDGYKGKDFITIQEITNKQFGGTLTTLRSDSFFTYSSLRKFLNNWEVL